jgi:hypothetical protein
MGMIRAYDSLKAAGRQAEWPLVLERAVQWESIAFVAAMLTGGLLYDGEWLNRNLLSPLGLSISNIAAHTLPVILTMVGGAGALVISFLVGAGPELGGLYWPDAS